MKHKILLILSIISLILLLTGCSGKSMTMEDMLLCKEGIYIPQKETVKAMADEGYEPKSIEIRMTDEYSYYAYNHDDLCVIEAHLKEPVMILGKQVKSIELDKCSRMCGEIIVKKGEIDGAYKECCKY
ncbi:MAG: hypothetical protein KAU20_07070 [Nanoarchaeota archaeon]|nr:hypothetical protein [Nanoarchaeota archaeon]